MSQAEQPVTLLAPLLESWSRTAGSLVVLPGDSESTGALRRVHVGVKEAGAKADSNSTEGQSGGTGD